MSDRLAQEPGERPFQDPRVSVLNPKARVPISFNIDDSTCLVNLNRFAIPQFASAHGDSDVADKNWRDMPVEIPDDFVRKFGEWCGEHGVKGKYSVVPYPACVGRVDRVLPGWTARELADSLDLVRTLMAPNWDIHPEMVTHTRVIDLKTGQPYAEDSLRYQENWEWTDGKSVDEIAAYIAYGLQILKNAGLECEGVTTPGGFGIRVLPEIAQATLQACRDVYSAEIPHYFRHIIGRSDDSVVPRVEYARGLDSDDPQCVVSIIGATGDWTGGWDNTGPADPDLFITADLERGRLVDVIGRGEPAVLVCHWTGIHFNGEEVGFRVFQEVVRRLEARYDHLLWMTNSELARYWTAKELTAIELDGSGASLRAPYACPGFTLSVRGHANPPTFTANGETLPLRPVADPLRLEPGAYTPVGGRIIACVDLPKGFSRLTVSSE